MLKNLHQPMRKWFNKDGGAAMRERFGNFPMFWQVRSRRGLLRHDSTLSPNWYKCSEIRRRKFHQNLWVDLLRGSLWRYVLANRSVVDRLTSCGWRQG